MKKYYDVEIMKSGGVQGNPVNWQPATKENEFVNEMWGLFDDNPKDSYEVSFEEMDLFFRNVFRWLNKDRNPEVSDTTGDAILTDDDQQKKIIQ